jgi:hypothetical protein
MPEKMLLPHHTKGLPVFQEMATIRGENGGRPRADRHGISQRFSLAGFMMRRFYPFAPAPELVR